MKISAEVYMYSITNDFQTVLPGAYFYKQTCSHPAKVHVIKIQHLSHWNIESLLFYYYPQKWIW